MSITKLSLKARHINLSRESSPRKKTGWRSPLDVYLSDTKVYQPDLIFISHARKYSIIHDRIKGAPDVVVEVLSPSTRNEDLVTKKSVYERSGVLEY